MRLYTYAGSANGYKIELLCALIAKPYDRVEVSIFEGQAGTPEFLAKNPAGRVPVLELDDGGLLPESNAILVNVARGSSYWPDEPNAQDHVLRWLMFEQSEIEPVIGSARFWTLTGRAKERADELARRLKWADNTLRVLDQELASRDWLVGDRPTIADVAVYAYSHLEANIGLHRGEHHARWCKRIEALPGFVAGPAPYDRHAMV